MVTREREKEIMIQHIRDVFGDVLADRLYVATEVEMYVDGFDQEMVRDLAFTADNFKQRVAQRERQAEKCL